MAEYLRQTLLAAPKDYIRGWKILRRKDSALETYQQIRDKTMPVVLGVTVPLLGLDAGLFVGTISGAETSIAIDKFVKGLPITLALGILAASGLAGTALGLLTSLAITPQARMGRYERQRQQETNSGIFLIK